MQDDGEEEKKLEHEVVIITFKTSTCGTKLLYVMLNFTCSTIDRPMFKKTFRQGVSVIVCITMLHKLDCFDVKLQCVFSCVSSGRFPTRMQSHTGCTCLVFFHCALSNVSLNNLI